MLIGFITLLVLVVLGVPVAFSVTFASLAIVLTDPMLSETTALQRMVSGVNSFTFIAIPFLS
ncbi:TRAP transporter large permease subunit [Vibrio alginolyticus]|uniref:TRAP transporter large permease subunit n=1 Tax=Vibrio alginolyticus TaxID=663 RepID=UPI003754D114